MPPKLPSPRSAIPIALAVAIGAGLLAPARAEEPVVPAGRMLCHLFERDLDKDRDVDTADRLSEIGKWVGTQEAAGFALVGIDFATAQKPTGYPQGWMNVCMRR